VHAEQHRDVGRRDTSSHSPHSLGSTNNALFGLLRAESRLDSGQLLHRQRERSCRGAGVGPVG
jgi:hypothetical protein